MDHECDVCHLTFENYASLGGHRGGHTRRSESPAQLPIQRMNGKCSDCDQQFDSQYKLAGHRRLMHSDWNTFKTDSRCKSRLLKERGHRCEICGLLEWMGKQIPIQLDHKDGNPINRSRENLRLICPNCHAQTDTYCGKNIGRPKCRNREKAKYPMYRSESYVTIQLNAVEEDTTIKVQ